MKNFIKKLFCRHEYQMIDGTCHMKDFGMSKGAKFKCCRCGKEIWSDIFAKEVNRKINKNR